jgi:hypothetical protein
MVSMLSSNVVDHGFEPLLGATIRCHYYVKPTTMTLVSATSPLSTQH